MKIPPIRNGKAVYFCSESKIVYYYLRISRQFRDALKALH